MFNIHILKKDFSPIKIATINRETSKITTVDIGLSSVDNFNSQVCKYIFNDKGYKTEDDEWFQSEDIKGVCFHILRWRRCTAYLVIQFSPRGTRYLCYFSDEIKHSAQSFGTSMEDVDKEEVFQCLENNLKNFLTGNKILKIFLNDKRIDLLDNIDNYKNLFGF